jgi:radical S-adenosyl methionine domain-containing protein 2
MGKLNFAGGEPFLYPKFIGELAKYCKDDLHIESVSIVTNGSLVKPNFFDSYGQYIDIIAISCDSFNEATNVKIGRGTGKLRLTNWSRSLNVKIMSERKVIQH